MTNKIVTKLAIKLKHNTKMVKRKIIRDKIIATKNIKKGLIIVYTGKGKGKSTAAFGMVLRAIAHKKNVAVVQFIKGLWKTGERDILSLFNNYVDIFVEGEGFTWETQDLERDLSAAKTGWNRAKKCILSGKYKMILLDELNIVLRYKYINLNDVLLTLKNKPKDVHLIITGRNAKKELIEIADLVTEMVEIKHPFKKGIKAQECIEF